MFLQLLESSLFHVVTLFLRFQSQFQMSDCSRETNYLLLHKHRTNRGNRTGTVLCANQTAEAALLFFWAGAQKGSVLPLSTVTRPGEILHPFRPTSSSHIQGMLLLTAYLLVETIKVGLHYGEVATKFQRAKNKKWPSECGSTVER